MEAFPNLSRNVPFCPHLFSFVLLGSRNRDKRGQTGTKQDISGQIGKRPHLASTPIELSSNLDLQVALVQVLDFPSSKRHFRDSLALSPKDYLPSIPEVVPSARQSGSQVYTYAKALAIYRISADRKRGHVKKRQKSSRSVENIFDTFRHFSRRAKKRQNRQQVSKIFSTIFARHRFSSPF